MILKYNKEEKFIERDNLIHVVLNLFRKEEHKLQSGKIKPSQTYSNFLTDKQFQFNNILWSYERINLDIDGSIKNEGK